MSEGSRVVYLQVSDKEKDLPKSVHTCRAEVYA